MGLERVPFVSMRIFSTTWGIGFIGAASIIMVKTISTEYGILTWLDDSISRDNFKSESTWTVLDDGFFKTIFILDGRVWLEKCSPPHPKFR